MSDTDAPPWTQLTTPAPAGTPDDGPGLLDKIRADLQMDDEWTTRTGRSLTWWGAPIPIAFTVSEPRLVHGDPTIKLTIAATLLTDVTATSQDVLAAINDVNRLASTGALVWLADERRVDLAVTHYAHAGVEPVTHLLSALGLLAYGEGVGWAPVLAESLGARVNVVAHPTSGVREDYDEMMTFTETQVLPGGEHANRWAGGELEYLAEYLTDNDIGISTGDDTGLTVEFPFADDESSIVSMPSSLGQLQCVTHPTYGAGLLSLLTFPLRTGGDALRFANEFNLGEYQRLTAIPAIGAWCVTDNGLVHNAFVPNYYRHDWVARNLALWAAARTQWAFEAMAPDVIGR